VIIDIRTVWLDHGLPFSVTAMESYGRHWAKSDGSYFRFGFPDLESSWLIVHMMLDTHQLSNVIRFIFFVHPYAQDVNEFRPLK
jgi:hypothetical protein